MRTDLWGSSGIPSARYLWSISPHRPQLIQRPPLSDRLRRHTSGLDADKHRGNEETSQAGIDDRSASHNMSKSTNISESLGISQFIDLGRLLTAPTILQRSIAPQTRHTTHNTTFMHRF